MKMTLTLKSTVIAHMLFEAEQKLKKCQQVSKTKAELRALCSEALSCVSEAKVSIVRDVLRILGILISPEPN